MPRLCECTWSPTAMSRVARPIDCPYLCTGAPCGTARTASLCPRGTLWVTTTDPSTVPDCRSRVATPTSSSGRSTRTASARASVVVTGPGYRFPHQSTGVPAPNVPRTTGKRLPSRHGRIRDPQRRRTRGRRLARHRLPRDQRQRQPHGPRRPARPRARRGGPAALHPGRQRAGDGPRPDDVPRPRGARHRRPVLLLDRRRRHPRRRPRRPPGDPREHPARPEPRERAGGPAQAPARPRRSSSRAAAWTTRPPTTSCARRSPTTARSAARSR